MRILIVGGGPAGLYFALLARKAHPDWSVTVVERNAPDATFGWGVVFNDKTQNYLKDSDEASWKDITEAFRTWDNVDVVHRGERVTIVGNRFSGIARLEMLQILQKHCAAAGVKLEFKREITGPAEFAGYDLVVAADGVNSGIRRQMAAQFQPSVEPRPNKYAWYGTPQLFHGLTLTFRENPHGLWIAHSYKFSKTMSTFIVECDPKTWAAAGMEGRDEEATKTYLEEVFREDLGTHPLVSNKSSWLQFQVVKNARWHHGNVILLGDALHTAHFSIGSGTRMALEDAIALFQTVEGNASVPAALAAFEAVRRPKVEDLQAAAKISMEWFETAKKDMHMAPVELAFLLMTRSGKIDLENLRKRDADFVERYEDWKAEQA